MRTLHSRFTVRAAARGVTTGPLRMVLVSSFVIILFAACGKKPEAIPQGWLLNGQPLVSAQNIVLPAGSLLYLPEKFTIEAAADTVVRVTQAAPGAFHLNLLYGTAMFHHQDVTTTVTAEVDAKRLLIRGARFLLQKKVGSMKLLVIDGTVEAESAGAKQILDAKGENYLEQGAKVNKITRTAGRDALKLFPELANFRPLLAAR